MVLLLNRSVLSNILEMREVIHWVESAFKKFQLKETETPSRQAIAPLNGTLLIMPCYIPGLKSLITKMISIYPKNRVKYNLPTVHSVLVLIDPETGHPLSIMDGEYITAMRTGAASGVASKYLARKNASTVGILGAGRQAETQLQAVYTSLDLDKAYVYSPTPAHREMFADKMSNLLDLKVEPVDSARKLVVNSDVICIATTSSTPVLSGEWIKEGTHLNVIGSFKPDEREVDTETIVRSKIVVDSMEAALKEAGDLIIPIKEGAITKEHIYGELGELICGYKKGRENDKEITLFKSVGLAIQDAATARLAYLKALENNVGTEIAL
ncbi:MAG: ornithine cyclodeaminase family protein [Candidatus Odinarchaeia archaeon]